ncbi:aspartyl protease AED1-like [Phragmites australis]|uniref:aspartyl protease AED1-like n=1 Tax=Phragmites australis TaxID=29695 RepID=UPI002D7A2F92|nr:aspartyl protease AED1-like [Phragmites australis]
MSGGNSNKAASNTSALSVVHRHGPCSRRRAVSCGDPGPGPGQGQLHIHKKIAGPSTITPARASKSASLPAGISLGTGDYIVSPCTDCDEQQDPLFHPAQSSTYSAVPCGAPESEELDSQSCSSDNKCHSGLFGKADGLFGLGREKVSLASQAAAKYGAYGLLLLPAVVVERQGVPIPLRSSSGERAVNGDGGLVGDPQRSRSPAAQSRSPPTVFATAGTVMHSSTVITRLPAGFSDEDSDDISVVLYPGSCKLCSSRITLWPAMAPGGRLIARDQRYWKISSAVSTLTQKHKHLRLLSW